MTPASKQALPRGLWPQSGMGRFTLIVAGLYLVKILILDVFFPPRTFLVTLAYDLIFLLLLIPLGYYAARGLRTAMKRLLWKIRRRLILASIFMALIPIVLIVSIFLLSAFLIYYQFNYYLVFNQLGLHTGQLEAYTLTLRNGVDNLLQRRYLDRSELRIFLEEEAQFIQANYPQASIHVQISETEHGASTVFHAGFAQKNQPADYKVPAWLEGGDFSGLVYDPVDPGVPPSAEVLERRTRWSGLSLRSVAFSGSHRSYKFSVEVSVPLDRFLLRKLKSSLGTDLTLALPQTGQEQNFDPASSLRPGDVIVSTDEDLLANLEQGQVPHFPMFLYPTLWENGQESPPNRVEVLYMQLSLTRLYQNLFLSESNISRRIADYLKFLLIFFLGVELTSVLIGFLLTRSITNAVDSLDRGTEIIQRGDFSHRIVVKSDDQLGTLAESFNEMVESVQSLMRERVEKERIERELEIAKEVQMQLFPKVSPAVPGLDICGICLPARTVSGDYYDYITFAPEVVGIVVGDICGKGISAALLMANLQATLRSRLSQAGAGPGSLMEGITSDRTIARLMEQLNKQIFDFTSPNKFASLFGVVFDQRQRTMTYCNAGHNPPILLKSENLQRLQTGGTVVGIFQDVSYSQESITLTPGDTLLAYTDGISEAVNEFGEEFGENRLEDILRRSRDGPVQRIQDQVIEAILEWSYGREREDDMTLVVARVNEDWEPTTRIATPVAP